MCKTSENKKINELEKLLEKVIKERDYYYNLYIKMNTYIIRK
jgi:hypothetical protein